MIICYLIRGHDGPIDLCSFVRYTPRFDSFLQQIKEEILGQLVRATLVVKAATSLQGLFLSALPSYNQPRSLSTSWVTIYVLKSTNVTSGAWHVILSGSPFAWTLERF